MWWNCLGFGVWFPVVSLSVALCTLNNHSDPLWASHLGLVHENNRLSYTWSVTDMGQLVATPEAILTSMTALGNVFS